jgi:membrane protease YdiL (CAAX protease family)
MNVLDTTARNTASALLRFWRRTPVLIRAILLAFLVTLVGVFTWQVLLIFVPSPWWFVLMAGMLWAFCKYFSGSWWPTTTAAIRKAYFRSTRLPADVWRWGLIAALLVVVVIESSAVITFRLVEFPAEAMDSGFDFSATPLWQVWLFIIMAALVAGICEEVGFRGYGQVPLEKRYGPTVAITIISIAFLLFHLNQAWAPHVLFHLFAVGVLWGVLAYATGSLLPGIISHTTADIINFSYWWTDVAGTFDKRPISETGIDAHFVVWAVVFVASLALFAWTAGKTLAARRKR